MKKIITIKLFFIIIAYNCYSQTTTTTDYDKFCGTWRWVNGTDTLKLFMKKDVTPGPHGGKPVLLGVHRYVKNGNVQQSSWMPNLNQGSILSNNFFAFFQSENPNRIDGGYFWDIVMKKAALPVILYNSNGTITFSLEQRDCYCPHRIEGPYALPQNVILVKL